MNHNPDKEVGRLLELGFDARGRLILVADIFDPVAMQMPSVSVSAMIGGFRVCHETSPTLCSAEILEVADISEFSLTRTAANLECAVFERSIPSPLELSHQDMMVRLKRVRELTQALFAKAA